jgi:hypothetical protein
MFAKFILIVRDKPRFSSDNVIKLFRYSILWWHGNSLFLCLPALFCQLCWCCKHQQFFLCTFCFTYTNSSTLIFLINIPCGVSSTKTSAGSVRPCFSANSLPIIMVTAFLLEIQVCWIFRNGFLESISSLYYK